MNIILNDLINCVSNEPKTNEKGSNNFHSRGGTKFDNKNSVTSKIFSSFFFS
jgi:hypothetical protein